MSISEAYHLVSESESLVVSKLPFGEVRNLLKTSSHDVSRFGPSTIEKSR